MIPHQYPVMAILSPSGSSWHDCGLTVCHQSSSSRPWPWQDPDSCPPAWQRPAEPSSMSPWGEKTPQPLYLSRIQRRERQNDPCQQWTAVFGDRLNSWHSPKFLGAYAEQTKPVCIFLYSYQFYLKLRQEIQQIHPFPVQNSSHRTAKNWLHYPLFHKSSCQFR